MKRGTKIALWAVGAATLVLVVGVVVGAIIADNKSPHQQAVRACEELVKTDFAGNLGAARLLAVKAASGHDSVYVHLVADIDQVDQASTSIEILRAKATLAGDCSDILRGLGS